MSVSLLPLSLVVVGGWLVWWGLRRRGILEHLPRDWRRVTGTVVDAGDGVRRPPRIEYVAPDGRRLRVPGPMSLPCGVGDDVGVLIDPSDPTRARLDLTAGEAARVVRLLLVTGGVLLVVGVVTAVVLI
jgi:hypothetical protein